MSIELSVVDSQRTITELSESSYRQEVPGFQVSAETHRRLGMEAIMDSIEEGSANVLGEPVVFTTRPSLWTEPGNFAPHVDGTFRGLSIHDHEGQNSTGILEMATLLDDTSRDSTIALSFSGSFTGLYTRYDGPGIEAACADIPHGPVHTASLEPGKLTVFSQGNITGLGRAIHFFKWDKGYAMWNRYSGLISDVDLSSNVLAERAKQLRLGIVFGQHMRLNDDMHRLDYYESETDYSIEAAISETTFGMSREDLKQAIKSHPGRNIVPDKRNPKTGLMDLKRVSTPHRQLIIARQRIARRLSELKKSS